MRLAYAHLLLACARNNRRNLQMHVCRTSSLAACSVAMALCAAYFLFVVPHAEAAIEPFPADAMSKALASANEASAVLRRLTGGGTTSTSSSTSSTTSSTTSTSSSTTSTSSSTTSTTTSDVCSTAMCEDMTCWSLLNDGRSCNLLLANGCTSCTSVCSDCDGVGNGTMTGDDPSEYCSNMYEEREPLII
mmetsp:Transcript_12485/g.18054  ORF Transcript_12485/g.18054 Transcript_12485/m.18054 type:complete len:190 (-) Transcript_12485:279-848(-)